MYESLRTGLVAALLLAGGSSAVAQITESPVTVQPGRFLLEMDALSLTLNRGPGHEHTAVGVATTFLTTGLTAHLDIQVGAELLISHKVDFGGISERNTGVGDLYFRTKWRFYDDPGTGTAVAVMPFVKLPTNSGGVGNDAIEGGIIVPWITGLPGGLEIAAMAQVDVLCNDAGDGHDLAWYFSGCLSRPVFGALGVYGELAVGKSTGGTPMDGIMGAGITLALSERTWWDVATYKGITSGAADWNHVVRFNFGF